MADFGVYAKFASISARVGTRASAVSNLEGWTDLIILNVETTINVMTRKIWAVDDAAFTALSVSTKTILTDAAACLAAMYVIQYDISGMPAREAETRLDFLYNRFLSDIKILEDVKTRDFLIKGV